MLSLTISRVEEIEIYPIEMHESTGNYFFKLRIRDSENKEYVFHFGANHIEKLKILNLEEFLGKKVNIENKKKGIQLKEIKSEIKKKQDFDGEELGVFVSTATRVSSKEERLKTVIPVKVSELLGIQAGTKLKWDIRKVASGEKIETMAIVKGVQE